MRTSTLFDCAAVYLGYDECLVEVEELPLAVTDDGFTRIDPAAKPIRVATARKDLDAFNRHLVERLLCAPKPV